MESSADALRALGVADPETTVKPPPLCRFHVPAPVRGEIVERLVGPGQLLQAGTTQCFTISDTSNVWVLVNVYQSDLGSVHIGDPADITTDAYPEIFRGRISYIAPALDPTTRTLQERIVTENPGDKLKKDMYVTATVQRRSRNNAPDRARCRRSARHGESAFRLRADRDQSVCPPSGDARRIVRRPHPDHRGLKEGERVSADGSLFLQFKNSLQQ